MRDSIFYAALRSLFKAFFAVVGVGLALFFLIALAGGLSSGSGESQLATLNTEEILPNAAGKRESLGKDAPVLLQIDINGIIGGEELNGETVRQMLVESREGDYKADRVKGVLLHIDTPGGTVTDAHAIFQSLKEYKEKYKVPVYAYVNGLCASGGMYIASAADKIYATDVSLIGSVGVIAPSFINLTKLMEKVGVEALTISAGKEKDALNPLRVWKPDEDQNYRQIVDFYYNQFVDLVVTHRPKLSREKLVEEYGAKIFPAALALDYGYIDENKATLAETVKALAAASKIEDDHYQLIRLSQKNWFKHLFTGQMQGRFGTLVHKVSISPAHDLMLQGHYLYLYQP